MGRRRAGRIHRALESLGFDTIWLSDIPMGAPVDPLVGLAFAAGRTKRLKLGANLVPIGRNPMLLAKQLAQLDRLSSGRLLISLVPGLDQPGERGALGIGDAKRGRLIDDIIPLLRQWWSGAPVDHHENRYDFADVIVRPLPRCGPDGQTRRSNRSSRSVVRSCVISSGNSSIAACRSSSFARLARRRHGATISTAWPIRCSTCSRKAVSRSTSPSTPWCRRRGCSMVAGVGGPVVRWRAR